MKGSFSPTIPGLQTVWDSTSMGTFLECPKKYEYRIIQDWDPLLPSVHLKFGILMHSGRERYYRFRAEGHPHTPAVCATIRWLAHTAGDYVLANEQGEMVWMPWRSDHDKKNLHSLLQALTWYLEHYRDDPASTYILANGKPAVELSFKLGTGIHAADGEEIFLSGHIDRIVEFDGGLWITDLKTTTYTVNQWYFDKYSPDNQISLYDFAGQSVLGLPVRGVIIDAIQLLADGAQFCRGIAHRSTAQRTEWFQDFRETIDIATQYAERERWPRNQTSCGHYGGCQFRPVCSSPPNVRDSVIRRLFTKRPWDPTKNR